MSISHENDKTIFDNEKIDIDPKYKRCNRWEQIIKQIQIINYVKF